MEQYKLFIRNQKYFFYEYKLISWREFQNEILNY